MGYSAECPFLRKENRMRQPDFYINKYDKETIIQDIQTAYKENSKLTYIKFSATYLGEILYDLYEFKPFIEKGEIVLQIKDILDTFKVWDKKKNNNLHFMYDKENYKHTRQDILNEYEYLQQDDPEEYKKIKEIVLKMEAPDFEDMDDFMWEVWTTDDFYREFLISAFERQFNL